MHEEESEEFTCNCYNCANENWGVEKFRCLTNDVITDLQAIHDQLYLDMENWDDPSTRESKLKKLLIKLENIETSVLYIYNELNSDKIGIESNFGMTLKLEEQEKDLDKHKCLHKQFRTEWYCQEQHLRRLVDEVHEKDMALRFQSMYGASQGYVLSKMLWKISNSSENLDLILAQESHTLGILQTFKNCLDAFTNTYQNQMPKPSSDEYLYALSLSGTISNISSTPDGRFFVLNRELGRTIIDDMIKSLIVIQPPNGESLKWIILSSIHNMMVCKEGEDYAKQNKCLLYNLANCLQEPHSNRIIILALKLLGSLTNKVSDELYANHIVSSLPVTKLKKLKKTTNSTTIGKQAKCVMGSIMKLKSHGNEKLIRTTRLNESNNWGCSDESDYGDSSSGNCSDSSNKFGSSGGGKGSFRCVYKTSKSLKANSNSFSAITPAASRSDPCKCAPGKRKKKSGK